MFTKNLLVELEILALIPYPIDLGPSQRFRLEIFLKDLNEKQIDFEIHSFYSKNDYFNLYQKGAYIKKAFIILKGFLKRAALLFKLKRFDSVYVQREITPIGPPIFGWIIKRVFRKRMIYDFDDAIWLPNFSDNNAFFHKLKYYRKTKALVQLSDHVIAGNEYLAKYALQWNDKTTVIPTVVDTERMHNPDLFVKTNNEYPVIGWTGSLSTMHHLDEIIPILDELYVNHKFNFLIISNKTPDEKRPYILFKEWNVESEIQDLMEIDLGIMPLKKDFQFAKGKCGFKLIQFMSLEKTVLASPLGVNSKIIDDQKNGYLCSSAEEWRQKFELFLNSELVHRGTEARKTIKESYSLNAVLKIFSDILKPA